MNQQIEISGHRVDVEVTHAAEKALAKMDRRVFAEMELYFSCLIRKKVRFYNALDDKDIVYVNDKLAVSFRPVMTQFCGKDYEGDEPPVTDFPIHRAEKFIPKWLKIDFSNGEWCGDFGFVG